MRSLLLTDLDGTLLRSDRTLSSRTVDSLHRLAGRGVVRAVATGRSLASVQSVLDHEAPIDFLIFSSGAGIVRWGPGSSEELLLAHTMVDTDIDRALDYFVREEMDVMIHQPAPASHRFGWLAGDRAEGGEDLRRRVLSFAEHAWPLEPLLPFRTNGDEPTPWTGPASMVLGITDVEDQERATAKARSALPGLRVVRTTSPINGRSLWLEVLPEQVSKASAGNWLLEHLGINHAGTFAVGNDYNDEELLAWASESAVVAGAPAALRARFTVVAGNDQDGVVEAIERFGL